MYKTARLTGPIAAVLGGIAVIAAPIANADPDSTDTVFLQVLSQQGISFPSLSDQTVVNAGKGVCSDWSQGANLAQTLSDVKSALSLSDSNSGFFIGAATQAYCPQYMNKATQS